jgi:hypothetical protein
LSILHHQPTNPHSTLKRISGTLSFALALFFVNATVAAAEALSFRTGVLPILTKAGCNAGACHGAATGQGGFKLSLLGYDPEEDHERITRELGGRRIDLASPEESLFLRKPTRQLEHEGGRRIARDSETYRTLVQWIAGGAQYGARDLHVKSLTVTPENSLLDSTNQSVQLRVTAVLSNSSREDVTALALYTSNDDGIAEVNKSGEMTTRGRGLTSIMVRYSGQVAVARLAVPFGKSSLTDVEFPANNFIDEHVRTELNRLGLSASSLASNSEFLRRSYLDLIGRLPTSDEARSFLAEPVSPARRREIIDDLLRRDDFVDFWTMKFADLLLISGKRAKESETRVYHEWLREQLARGTPFDSIARSLLTAQGQLTQVGPANFFTLANDPRDLAEHVGRIFLGTQIACARCHAHPADRWTQDDYHRFAAYFARVSRDGETIKISNRGQVDHPKTGRPLSAKPLGAPVPSTSGRPDEDPRAELTAWLTSKDNSLFSRTIVNRVWRHLLGRGLVEPVDDLRPTNPPTLPALLDTLAQEFVSHGHDLRWLIQTIASSRTYQLSSKTSPSNQLDDRFYSHGFLKELSAQVFVDAVAQATGVADEFEGYPAGTRAIQLIGAHTASYSLDVLGRCSRDRPCDGASRSGGGLAQALHLINGRTINAKLNEGITEQLLARNLSDRAMIEELYLRTLTRRPDRTELAEWEPLLARATDKSEAIADLLWALLNSREFAFNH